jgi:hypothetical protein
MESVVHDMGVDSNRTNKRMLPDDTVTVNRKIGIIGIMEPPK